MPAPTRSPAAPPTVLALLLAAHVHRDGLGHGYLLGLYNGYHAPSFPTEVPRSFLYLALTEGHGTTPLAVRLVDGADDDALPLYAFDFPPLTFASPLEVKEIALTLPKLTIPRPGVLRWQVLCAGAVVYERRVLAELRDRPG